MKIAIVTGLSLLMIASSGAYAQKFRVMGPPANGFFYMDTVDRQSFNPKYRCLNIVSSDSGSMVYSMGRGKVIFCEPHADRTYDIGIKYASAVVMYSRVTNKKILNTQFVDSNAIIGEMAFNPKDKMYHLGLQVTRGSPTNEYLWFGKLVRYLRAYLVTNEILAADDPFKP